jgi:PadR family transcriptional regulator, regulatory protein PadR
VKIPCNAWYGGWVRTQELKGHLDLLVLSAVAAGPRHGYLIVDWLREQSGQEFELPENTVYAALHRLEHAGFLRSARASHQGRTRREYSLSPNGRRALAGKRVEWERFARGMQGVIEAAQ